MLSLVVLSLLSFVVGPTIGQAVEPRIVGGSVIPITSAPYQVSIRMISYDNLQFGGGFFCGGSLIARDLVLTAAHCLYNENSKLYSASDLQVVGGNAILLVKDNNTFVTGISSLKVHESYKHGTSYSNDIALLKLKTNVTLTNTVKLINLPTKTYPVGASGFITGWGTTQINGSASAQLRGAYVTINNATQCNQAQYLNGAVKSGMFCAGSFAGGIDACQGDSGGPLNNDNIVYGITSHGYECALPRYPGIYTDVYYYREWVLKNNAASNIIGLKILIGAVLIAVSSIFSVQK